MFLGPKVVNAVGGLVHVVRACNLGPLSPMALLRRAMAERYLGEVGYLGSLHFLLSFPYHLGLNLIPLSALPLDLRPLDSASHLCGPFVHSSGLRRDHSVSGPSSFPFSFPPFSASLCPCVLT